MPTVTSTAERAAPSLKRDAPDKQFALDYSPFPKQQAFHASPAKYRLFGGAAGPGKSKALLMEAILQAHEHPGSNTLLLRRTFPELEQSLLLYFRRDVPRELYKSFNESKHVVEWQNGSTTRFGYCAAESDVYQYQGAEFLFIGIDELTMFTLRQWQFLTSRNRCPIPGAFPCMAGATNPGNIGHAWVKSLWIDRRPAPGIENASAYDPGDYDFIPARIWDNPIYAQDENYLKSLRALPSHLRRAFLDGDWEVFAGQYFDNFDCTRHVFRPEQIRGPQVPGGGSLGDRWKPWWQRWISIDWGFEHPAATYWHASLPPGTSVPIAPEGHPASHRSSSVIPGEPRNAAEEGVPPVGAGLEPAPASEVRAQDDASAWEETSARRLFEPEGPDQPQRSASTVEGRGFSPAINDGRPAPTSLPEAVAEREAAERQHRPRHDDNAARVVTYREYVTRHTSPRELAREIARRSGYILLPDDSAVAANDPRADREISSGGRNFSPDISQEGLPDRRPVEPGRSDCEALPQAFFSDPRDRTSSFAPGPASLSSAPSAPERIDAIYLSPDAFARRTDEASIADQMGAIFAAAGLPRPVPADDDRVGGWMLMYQMLDAAEWLITENCLELIRCVPSLVRDPVRIEDVEKMDGDDPADAARYGLKSRFVARLGDPGGWRSRVPLADRLAAHAYSADPTIRAMQARKFLLDESRGPAKPVSFLRRHHGPPRQP
jgi:hypothetical protein